ncbi:MAG: hypothetical protein P1V81_02230 [Planctomycetota bacterium]|nr:hypothetical protein [Planctomycetota bacterium]
MFDRPSTTSMLPLALCLTAACASTIEAPPTPMLAWDQVAITPIADVAVEIHVPGDPDFLEVFDAGSAWIMNPSTDAVELVTDAGVVTQVAGVAPIAAICLAFDSLWVAGERGRKLLRIDPIAGDIVARIDTPIVGYESTIAAAGGKLWLVSDRQGTLTFVDPSTDSLVGETALQPRSFGVAAGFGSVWVTCMGPRLPLGEEGERPPAGPGLLQRVDATTGELVATIEVGPTPLFLACGEGAVWVINQGDGTVSRVDPETDTVEATIAVGIDGPGGDIAVGEGLVWVRASKTLLSVIDPTTNAVVARFGPPAGSGGVRAGHGSVWISAHDTKQVWRLPVTGLGL